MIKLINKISLIYILTIFLIQESKAIECRSMLAEYLKPISNEIPLSWAFEATLAGGVLTDRYIINTMALLGLDLAIDNNTHQFYVEGGMKHWYNSNPGAGQDSGGQSQGYNNFLKSFKNKVNFREAFYKYNGSNLKIITGLQSSRLGDYMMFDERMVGLQAHLDINSLSIQASIGTVTADFARMANFCGTRHIYNITHSRRFDFWGTRFWETNFIGVVGTLIPSRDLNEKVNSKSNNESTNKDSIISDEFDYYSDSEFQALNDNSEVYPNFLEQVGLLFYEEFGSGFNDYKYYIGGFGQINLPLNFSIKSELVNQYILNERTWAYLFQLEKSHSWESGDNTSLRAGIIGKIDVDDSSHFYPSFSNFFLGEILRLDAINIPIIYASIKHNFAWQTRLSLKFQAVYQLEDDKSNEIDFEANIKLFKHIKLTAILSRVQSNLLNELYYMFRLELRAGI